MEIAVEVLVGSDVEQFNAIRTLLELVGKEEFERSNLELDDPNSPQTASLWFAH